MCVSRLCYGCELEYTNQGLDVDRTAMLEFSRRGLGCHDPDAHRNPGGRIVISRKSTVGGLDLSHGSLSNRTGGRLPATNPNEPIVLLHLLVNLQNQTLDSLRQLLEVQRQQLDLARETVQVSREQRARQGAELERWQVGHDHVLDACRDTLGRLEQVHASLMGELAHYVEENHENLLEGDFSLSDFVDRFGPRLAHLNTMLAVLRPLAAAQKKAES